MILRGIDFGNALGGSGVQGFFGEGYWFHKPLKLFGLDFDGMTLVAKTVTLMPRKGNMTLSPNYMPWNPFPGCIKANPLTSTVVNSVGLSNAGLIAHLATGRWQELEKPFFLSLMSLASTKEQRLEELAIMIAILKLHKHQFTVPFGVQVNISCPNQHNDPKEIIREVADILEISRALDVPIMLKFSIASAPIEAIMELNNNPHCDAICVSNSVPYDWEGIGQRVWGKKVSPLKHLGGGGLSGKALRPLVCTYIQELRSRGFTKPITGGGGILSPADVGHYHKAGASSVALASIAIVRPWRVAATINRANALKWN